MLVLTPLEWVGLPVFVVAAYVMLFPLHKFKYDREKIRWGPPEWVFTIIWAVMYALIGVSGFFFWRTDFDTTLSDYQQSLYSAGLFLFFGNLILDKLWPILFFGYDLYAVALVNLLVMSGTGIAYVVLAGIINETSTWVAFGLFMPYALWVLFAGVLNAQFAYQWMLEGQKHGRGVYRGRV
jgi:tryptophan-rich sensory protein